MNNLHEHEVLITSYLESLQQEIINLDNNVISQVLEVLKKALHNQANIFIIGNGGSASTASHLQNDFSQAMVDASVRFNVHCLTDNIATITAIANDYSFDEVFLRQLRGRLQPEDLVIAISTSGNSKNIIRASEYVKSTGNILISMTGFDGGKLMQMADYRLHVASSNIRIIEDVHLVFNHLLIHCLIQRGNS